MEVADLYCTKGEYGEQNSGCYRIGKDIDVRSREAQIRVVEGMASLSPLPHIQSRSVAQV